MNKTNLLLKKTKNLALALLILLSSACMKASEHAGQLHSQSERELTLGVAQAKLYKGMSQAEVAEILGSPNIVTKDAQSDDTWIYDKISSEASYSNDGGGVNLIIFGGYNKNSGASATTQKTLTIVVKFDANNKIKDFSYHTSRF